MAKLTLVDLGTTLSNTAATTINVNNNRTEAALENTLSRDGTSPNQMLSDFDLNHNDLLNGGIGEFDSLTVGDKDFSQIIAEVEADAIRAENAANSASASADEAEAALEATISRGAEYVQTRTELKAVDTTKRTVVFLKEAGRQGTFMWSTGNYTARVAADTTEALYLKADAFATSVGAWVRVYSGLPSVTWFGANTTDIIADSAPAFTAAIALVGKFTVPQGTFGIGSTLVISRDGVRIYGQGGLIDGAIVHFESDLASALSRVGTRLIWVGAVDGTMIRAQPYLSGASWRNGFGFGLNDLVLDCAETAGTGFQNLSHCFQEHHNVTISRFKYAGWDMGVSNNLALGTSDSNGNNFYNCWAINRGAGTACIPGIGWWYWGDGGVTGVTAPKGNFCESNFHGGGSYPHASQTYAVEGEYSDTLKFFGFQWSGRYRLHAWDTGVRGLSDGVATPAKNSQALHFSFYGYGGLIEVKKSIANPTLYDYNPFGHVYYDYPLVNIGILPIIEGPAANALKIYMPATPLEPSGGAVSWGGSKAVCTVNRTSALTLTNNTETSIPFQAVLKAPLGGWAVGDPAKITVPNGVKLVRVNTSIQFAAGAAVGINTLSLYKSGVLFKAINTPGSTSVVEMNLTTRWIPVTGGDTFQLTAKQQSGGNLNLIVDAVYSTPFFEVEFA